MGVLSELSRRFIFLSIKSFFMSSVIKKDFSMERSVIESVVNFFSFYMFKLKVYFTW